MSSEARKIEYLPRISSPEDLKAMPKETLGALADEIRSELVRVVSDNGGHLASNLGVVELTMAIHRVFDCPRDHLIFDVGHQSYVHKMLTGRYALMDGIRQPGGISGFQKRSESEYDCFGAGHSSTSLSAALGFATADKLSGSDAYTVAVVGDGAYTGGMIHEALNNCKKDLRLVIILNENEMSISKNIGSFATSLSRLRASSGYFKTKRATGIFLKKIPLVGKGIFNAIKHLKMMFKNALYGSNYFESMGLTYLGPVDGNNYEAVEKLLLQAKKLNESVIVHVKTTKGKGYEPAESSPASYHSMTPGASGGASFSSVMGHALADMGESDGRLLAITAAMSEGTGLEEWRVRHPDRFFDVGIAESHAMTFAAGLAANSMRPCVAIYSTFMQRAYDNVIHDVALQRLPVLMLIDRAGLNARDGATHHGIFDVAFLSHIPNVRIYTPVSYRGLVASMQTAIALSEPAAIRYPSGKENPEIVSRFYAEDSDYMQIGVRCDFARGAQKDVLIVTHGRIVAEAVKASESLEKKGITTGIILLEMLKPYTECARLVTEAMPNGIKAVLFLEEEIRSGGAGMNLSEKLFAELEARGARYSVLATNDDFVESVEKGSSIFAAAGVDAQSIVKTVAEMLE